MDDERFRPNVLLEIDEELTDCLREEFEYPEIVLEDAGFGQKVEWLIKEVREEE